MEEKSRNRDERTEERQGKMKTVNERKIKL